MLSNHKYSNVVFRITMTGLMLGLTILFNYLSQFGKFSFLEFDFSLIFVYVTFFYIWKPGAFIIILIRFAIGPSYSAFSYHPVSLTGHSLLLITTIVFLATYWLMVKIFKMDKMNDYKRYLKFKILTFLITIIVTTLFMYLINLILFTPLYFYILNIINKPTIALSIEKWVDVKAFFFGMPSYWLGVALLFIGFNLMNLTFNSIIIFIIDSFVVKNYSHRFRKEINVKKDENI